MTRMNSARIVRNLAVCSLFAICFGLVGNSIANASPYSAAVMADSPIDYWQFAGPTTSGSTSLDQGSNGVAGNGTYHNGVTAGTGLPASFFGMTGDNQSISFAGAGSITGSDALEVTGNNSRTVTAWVNTTTVDGTYHDIFFYGTNAGTESIFTLVPPSNTDTNFKSGGNFVPGQFGMSQNGGGVGTSGAINDGSWHFVAGVITPDGAGNATYSLYVDGKLEATKDIGTSTVLGGTYYIGTDPFPFNYTGQLAQMAIFDTALSGSQINSLFVAANVPEPASLMLGGLGLAGLMFVVRRHRRKAG